MSNLSVCLKELRLRQGFTQKELSAMLGIVLRAYQRYEAGDREPNVDTLIKLADFYGVSMDELLGRTPLNTR